MKYFIFTFGCQMNESDSQKIRFSLEKIGHKPVDNASSADLLVFNSCSVRQTAVDRIYGQIRNNPGKKIIIAGCLLEYDKKRLSKNKNVSFWHPDDYFDLPPINRSGSSALVPIMTGCNNFCSYCVVPYTRGREKSRPAKEIINEIRKLVQEGCKEIVLIGQNVNSYKDKKISFPKLLKQIDSMPGNFRLNFLTSHPKNMSDELIETMAKCSKLVKELHLPVQSGDNTILRKMNRHYTVTHYKKLIKKVRRQIPDIKVSTDIIVGFPGETEKQFQNTANLARQIDFDKAFIAKYSPRPGTAAAKLTDNIPAQEKIRRWRLLDTLINKFEHVPIGDHKKRIVATRRRK